MTIYLNASSHGLSDPVVFERMARHLAREAEVGEVRAAEEAAAELEGVRAAAAALIGAEVADTGLAANTSAPWEAMVLRMGLSGRRVLVAAHEWFSNVDALRAQGARIEVVSAAEIRDPAAWAARLDGDTAAIFAPMVTSVAGIRYPVEAIGALERPEGCLFVVDAAQALGQVPIDVAAMGCDALVGTTRKWLRGPFGTALYWMGARARAATGLRPAAENLNRAVALGQGEALRLAGRAGALPTDPVRAGVRALGLEPLAEETGAVTVRIPPDRAGTVRDALAAADCVVKWPDAAADEPLSGEGGTLLRLSPHVYNTGAGIEVALAAIAAGLG